MTTVISEKRTTTKTTSEAYPSEVKSSSVNYHSNITPRGGIENVKRSSFTPMMSSSHSSGGGGGGRSYIKTEYSYGTQAVPGSLHFSSSSSANAAGVDNVKTTREKEKKDMRDLNERLANYIEKVRFLEAQNKKLAAELDELRTKWGSETAAIKHIYETELDEARKVLDDTAKDKSRLEIRVKSLEEQNQDLQRQLEEAKKYRQIDRDQINKLNQQLAEYDGEISMLRRMLETMEKDRERDRLANLKLQEDVDRLRLELNAEMLAHMDAENRRQTLEEEIQFMKEVHEQEMKELASLAYRDTTAENREFWRSELSGAIRDIQNEYDSKVDQIRGDMEAFYNLKVQEIRTGASKQNMETTHAREEVKKLRTQLSDQRGRIADLEARNAQLERQYQDLLRDYEERDQENALENSKLKEEITKLRAEMESILHELQVLMDAKLSLELEIAAYRKLLEGEESRVGLRSVVEQMISTRSVGGQEMSEMVQSSSQYSSSSENQMAMKMMRGEVSAKTTFQRTSKGAVSITEASPDGKYILLENNSSGGTRKDEDLEGWSLKRVVDGKKEYIHRFRNVSVKSGKNFKVWARGSAGQAGLNDLVFKDEDTWGVGSQVTTTLINDKGEERASHIQKTLYQ